jgi:glycine dehydrogenase subunit 1
MRYLPLTNDDRQQMLARIGITSVDDLFTDVPDFARLDGPIHDLPLHQGEREVEKIFTDYAVRNLRPGPQTPCFIGGGAYWHHVPAAVDYLIQRGEFLTSYTPYQPEITQGTLQVLFEFQTQVALLTGMDVANASMYDGSTAAAEAVAMANRITKRNRAVISGNLHPHYRQVIETHGDFTGFDVTIAPVSATGSTDIAALIDGETSCVVVQNPDFFGHVADLTDLATRCQTAGALLIVVVTEAVSLGLLTPPGAMGADIVVAEGQSFGNPLGFGGPYVGLFATREKYVRQMPGRLCGQTVDAEGRRGFVLTLSTREQHIRREKATSNICTNAGLCALAFSIHVSLLGEQGVTTLARLNHEAAITLADALAAIPGVTVLNQSFFNEFTIRLPQPAAPVVDALAAQGILAGLPASRLISHVSDVENLLILAATEQTDQASINRLVDGLRGVLN